MNLPDADNAVDNVPYAPLKVALGASTLVQYKLLPNCRNPAPAIISSYD
jgi:hypothetical protein